MKAIVKLAPEPGALAWQEWPEPALKSNHVLIQIEQTGICSTDVAIYDWTYKGRHPVETPTMLGHEAAGTVVAIGSEVDDVRVGDRVTPQVVWGHPHARESLLGWENLDPDWFHIGASPLGGTFAERISVPADRVLLLPDSVASDDAALLEPLALAVHAVELARLQPGDSFLLVGPGPFGLLMCQIARVAGASRIAVVGIEGVDERRLEIAERIGATDLILFSGDTEEAARSAADATQGGANVVMDCGGTPESVFLSLEAAAPAGRISVFGFAREARIEPLRQVIRKGLSLFGVSIAQRRHYGAALRLIETGTVRPSEIVSHRLAIPDAETGIQLHKSREASKVLLAQAEA